MEADTPENYSNTDLREAISALLSIIDSLSPTEMHHRGNTLDWFVAAAMMACNIEDTPKPALDFIKEYAKGLPQ